MQRNFWLKPQATEGLLHVQLVYTSSNSSRQVTCTTIRSLLCIQKMDETIRKEAADWDSTDKTSAWRARSLGSSDDV